MKVLKPEEAHWRRWYQDYDPYFIRWICEESLPEVEEAIKKSNGMVFIHKYPKLPNHYALLCTNTQLIHKLKGLYIYKELIEYLESGEVTKCQKQEILLP